MGLATVLAIISQTLLATLQVGKTFSILAVIAALAPVAGNPLFRQLYNLTIDTFPGSIFVLGSALGSILQNFISSEKTSNKLTFQILYKNLSEHYGQ
jgi:hypothetical protein